MINLFLESVNSKFNKLLSDKKVLGHINSGNFPFTINGPEHATLALLVARLHAKVHGSTLIVVPTEREAEELVQDLALFSQDAILFPWLNIIPYEGSRPHAAVLGQRARALSRMIHEKVAVVAPLRSFLYPVPPPETIKKRCLTFAVGDEIETGSISRYMTDSGYERVPKASIPGEYALRGEVLDIFPVGMEEAFRIIFEFDTIEEIRTFEPGTQISHHKLDSCTIYPVKEFIWTDERIESVERKIDASLFNGEHLRESGSIEYEELLYTLSCDTASHLSDYIGKNGLVYFTDDKMLEKSEETIMTEAEKYYRSSPFRTPDSPLKPENIFFSLEECARKIERKIYFPSIRTHNDEQSTVDIAVEGPTSFFGNINYLKEELGKITAAGTEVWIFCESESQAPRIEYLLQDFPVQVAVGRISGGFTLPEAEFTVIQENEIFGRRKRIPKSVKTSKTEVIDTFVELNPGDFVVHLNYGIGKFHGIERISAVGTERDYIQLEYGNEEMIFIPIEQVNMVQKYIGSEGSEPRLDKIGGKSWESRKQKVRAAVEDLAGRLIKLYSRRKQAQGHAFAEDTEWQIEFEAAFPYEETEDQLTCIREVKEDMESPQPMDRMICGDVGYGKTEVAMRAVFKAVTGGKQVAFLAPTTILAEQHQENFEERFEHYPVTIRMLSRFVSKDQQKKAIAETAEGKVDVLIGTHRILQKDVHFKNLGLIVIDEEQRFGVKDKERLKELKHSVDCLTLTATPIPRTLHMSLLKIRDMSLLRTPPSNRLPIETYIGEFNPETVRNAIIREMDRGGQIFYLHNRIETLDQVRTFLNQLIPEAIIDEAHGRMKSKELEEIMHRFIHGGTQVLVSTTIIENGIDIPNVNTIIIDRADMYGLSQLYQLRGRVGRADVPAFAYLLYPEDRVLTETAMKRLRIMSEYTDLGSGFKIAMKDLEVRGAGNLLGREQHGDILSVGFDMYLRLLDEAIADMQDDKEAVKEEEVYLELEYSGYIPDSYIEEPDQKMEIYKRIAAVNDDEELQHLFSEIEDRFGPLPEEILSLMALAEIRILCRKMKIRSLKERNQQLEIEFGRVSEINIERLVKIVEQSEGKVKINPEKPNFLQVQTGIIGLKEKSEFIREMISRLR